MDLFLKIRVIFKLHKSPILLAEHFSVNVTYSMDLKFYNCQIRDRVTNINRTQEKILISK